MKSFAAKALSIVFTACVCVFASPIHADTSAVRESTLRFDIPAGSLSMVIVAFQALTGLKVVPPPGVTIEPLGSPGVSGVYTAAQALEKLLAGTSLTFRIAATTVMLELRVAPENVVVTGHLTPYRVQASAAATRTATPLRDIPQTITVVPRELLRDQNARSVADAVRNVPGVSIAQGEGNRDQVVIRGINTSSDFFVNGIRDDQERFRDLYNVESVEVLQGPAAVLFGRGGAGGVVNIVTAQPTPGVPADVRVDFGSYGHKRATAQVGAPLGSLATLRLNAMAEDSGGFRDAYFLHRYGINPTVGLALSDRTTMTLGVEYLYDRRRADRGIPSRDGRPVAVSPGLFFGSTDQNHSRNEVGTLSATVEHRFSGHLTLRNSFLLGRYDKYYQNVYAGSAVSTAGTFTLSGYNSGIDRTNAFNQTDLTYAANVGGMKHLVLVGFEVGHQMQDEKRHSVTNLLEVPLSNSVRDADFSNANLAISRHAASDVVAGYLQDQVVLSPHWKAVIGARADWFKVSVDDRLPQSTDLARADTAVSPRAGLIYQPNAVASLYTSYSRTFLPSGQTLGLATNTVQLTPENAKNYEVGAKVDLLARRLTLAAAVFRLDRNNVRNTDPNDSTRLVLTGQQRTEGFVLSAAGNLLPNWKVYGGYAHLDGRITRTTSAAPAGRRVGLVPRDQFTLWTTYDVSERWGAGGGIVDQSKVYTSFSNQVELPRFTRVDAVGFYRVRGFRLAVNVENLLNVRYYPTAHNDNNISPGSPRSVQLSVSAVF